jgi:hypothetical protein
MFESGQHPAPCVAGCVLAEASCVGDAAPTRFSDRFSEGSDFATTSNDAPDGWADGEVLRLLRQGEGLPCLRSPGVRVWAGGALGGVCGVQWGLCRACHVADQLEDIGSA